MSEWQPIDTAPKDQLILGWVRMHGYNIYEYRKSVYGGASGWQLHIPGLRVNKPTHWMPLPSPPQEPRK